MILTNGQLIISSSLLNNELTQLLVMYIDEAFAKMYIQHPFVATEINKQKEKIKKRTTHTL